MATLFLSNAKTFALSHHAKTQQIVCRAEANEQPSNFNVAMSRRSLVCLNLTAASLLAFAGFSGRANAAILEADDDLELVEKVKKDRKKRLEKQGVISTSSKETGTLPYFLLYFSL